MKKSQIRQGAILAIDSSEYTQRIWVRVLDGPRFVDKHDSGDGENRSYLSMRGCERLFWDEVDKVFVPGEGVHPWHLGQVFHLRTIIHETTDEEWRRTMDERLAERAAMEAEENYRRSKRHAYDHAAKQTLVSMLTALPPAFVAQTDNGFPRTVEMAHVHGVCDLYPAQVWGPGPWDGHANVDQPDADVTLWVSLTALAAVAHAWTEVYGDSPWDEILAAVYERHQPVAPEEGEEVNA